VFFDKNPPGWLAWPNSICVDSLPNPVASTFSPWESASADAIEAVRELVTDSTYWEAVSSYYSEENHETTIIQDNVSCVKSICESGPFFLIFH
jgi:proteasome activator subunit 4